MTKLSESRAEMNSKADIFQEVTKDVALYKYERDNIDLKLKDIKQELDIKVAKNDFYEMRLLFDSQFTTERVKN
jgi:tRNA threonylcarbamoyladenosine modification (KEOPS) complex  Pcc1 subunit